MTLGTRVTVVVTLLVAAVLAGSGYAALKVRRANLEADLDREAHEIATALRAGIEPLDRSSAEETLLQRARAARQHDELFALEVLSVGDDRVAVLAASAQLAEEIDAQAAQQSLDTALSEAESGDGEPAEAKYARAQLRAAGQA